MGRVKEVEEILQTLSLFLIVQIDGNKGQKGPGLPQKTDTHGNGFLQGIGIKEVQNNYQQNPLPIIIPMEEPSCAQP